jgi:hypothetical protein
MDRVWVLPELSLGSPTHGLRERQFWLMWRFADVDFAVVWQLLTQHQLQPDVRLRRPQVKLALGRRKKMGKKQHYIPRVLLRNFSVTHEGATIGIYLFSSRKVVIGPLKDQCYRTNLYGSDQELEKMFCDIEGQSASAFRKLIEGRLDLSELEEVYLRVFLIFQHNRTPQAEKDLQQTTDKQMRHIAKDIPGIGRKVDAFRIQLKNPFHMLAEVSGDIAPILSDLKTALIVNRTTEPFVIGQYPVLVLNPFLEDRKWYGAKNGLGSKGVVVLLPISPSIAVVLYDRSRYRLSTQSFVGEVSDADVHYLNYLQFALSETCVYFSSFDALESLNEYNTKTEEYRGKEKSVVRVFRSSDKKSKDEIIQNEHLALPGIQKFDFICLKAWALAEPIEQRRDIIRESIEPFIKQLEKNTGSSTMSEEAQRKIGGRPFVFKEKL